MLSYNDHKFSTEYVDGARILVNLPVVNVTDLSQLLIF